MFVFAIDSAIPEEEKEELRRKLIAAFNEPISQVCGNLHFFLFVCVFIYFYLTGPRNDFWPARLSWRELRTVVRHKNTSDLTTAFPSDCIKMCCAGFPRC